jgi:hypothetical protein
VVLVVIRSVHAEVLLLSDPPFGRWLSAMDSCVTMNAGVLEEKVNTITSQVAVIVKDIKHRDISSRLNRGTWKFSEKEAEVFAKRLAKCVDDNLM